MLKRDPDHVGATHFIIHAVEKTKPELGVPAADELAKLPDGAPGHLIHMASHIYIRVGRYDDAVRSNRRAIAADEAYKAEHGAPEFYAAVYMPHNRHMLWASASLDGRKAMAMETARGLADYTKEMLRHPQMAIGAQHFWLSPLYAMVRWGMWNEILAVPEPEADLVYPRAAWHYAQGLAALRTGKTDAAEAHAAALRQTLASGALDALMYNFNSTANLMKIASNVLDGEILAAKGDTANVGRALRDGDRDRGRAGLRRAAALARAGAPEPRRRAAQGRQAGRSGGRVPRRPRRVPVERLVALRPGGELRGAGQGEGRVAGAGPVRADLEALRREARSIGVLIAFEPH